MKYDVHMSYTVKIEGSEEGKSTETTTQSRARKIDKADVLTKVTEFLSNIPDEVSNLYLEVHKNWDSDMDAELKEY